MKTFFLFFCLSAFALGCGETQVTNVYSGGVAGKLVGNVRLWDSLQDARNAYLVLDDHSGVRIEVGGKYFALSDKTGYWEIDNVPPGSYTLSLTKDGFVSQIYPVYNFAGNGADYLNNVLYRLSHWNVDLILRPFEDYLDDSRYKDTIILDEFGERVYTSKRDSVFYPLGRALFTAQLLNHPGVNPYYARGLIVFGRAPHFSLVDPSTYVHRSDPQQYDRAKGMLNFSVMKEELLKAGFTSGEKIYCAAFATTAYSHTTDIKTFKAVFYGFEGCTNEVKSFILP